MTFCLVLRDKLLILEDCKGQGLHNYYKLFRSSWFEELEIRGETLSTPCRGYKGLNTGWLVRSIILYIL